jgi:hypothetical protein
MGLEGRHGLQNLLQKTIVRCSELGNPKPTFRILKKKWIKIVSEPKLETPTCLSNIFPF